MSEVASQTLQKQDRFILKYIETFGVITWACKKARISRRTYYDWLKNKEFEERISIADDIIQDKVEEMYLKEDLPKGFNARKFWLERRTKKYKPIQKLEIDEKVEFIYDEKDFPKVE